MNIIARIKAWLTNKPLEVYSHLDDFDWEEEDN